VTYSPSPLVLLPADLATISQSIVLDPITSISGSGRMAVPGAFVYEGFVFVPNRQARIKLFPGDVVCVTSRGFPIVISADEIANGTSFTYT
jgi:hypothetical protein